MPIEVINTGYKVHVLLALQPKSLCEHTRCSIVLHSEVRASTPPLTRCCKPALRLCVIRVPALAELVDLRGRRDGGSCTAVSYGRTFDEGNGESRANAAAGGRR
ncbi:hypothetical protein MAPG_05921 [Magnaporthiopsis poae ATCC 64411]|uniref:Uncharacterized protein n=1 Tax=Magnaporthiopsis poae (strain ATCC 64411 / 73-15) TaxID=644358 RepID=A0A0C4E0P0_MAGP6|nr:hypothetical protein MAPG_05921 [Magnaporthiopsis poae ATCC 64411]